MCRSLPRGNLSSIRSAQTARALGGVLCTNRNSRPATITLSRAHPPIGDRQQRSRQTPRLKQHDFKVRLDLSPLQPLR